MDARLGYWFFAFGLLAAAVVAGIGGRFRARRGDHAGHRKLMIRAGLLIGVFLASYPVKLLFLGREDLSSWSRTEIAVLRFHELNVALMLIFGAIAFKLMRQERRIPVAPSRARTIHRNMGRVAVAAGLLGLLTAGGVLGTMVNNRRLQLTRLDGSSLRR